MAGRCAERLVLGEANVSTAGAADLEHANGIAREMVFRCGFRRVLWSRAAPPLCAASVAPIAGRPARLAARHPSVLLPLH